MEGKGLYDWIFRFIKGMLIGTGAILPGVSGGALAAVFGFYERLISFIANLTKDFKKNFLYFFPVGLGGVFGIFLLSFALSYFLENAEIQILWFFVGCIIGILPALFNQAAKKGRNPRHIIIMIFSTVISLYFLYKMQNLIGGSVPLNFYTWIMAGGIFALGMIVPGLSPSNFLVYMDMYKPMTDGIKSLDFQILIPMGIGAVITVIAFSKLINFIFEKAYATLFHIILGVVFASTIMIIPLNFNYLSLGALVCAVACFAGICLGGWMSKLEEEYKPEI